MPHAPFAPALLLAAACFAPPPARSPLPPLPPPTGFPRSEGMDYEPTFGDPLTFEARYVVAPVTGGKDLQAVTLQRDDGEAWIRSYRPVSEELGYVDKRVVVSGRPYTNSPYVQSVGGTHFELTSIALAPGETAWEPPPAAIPSPPVVEGVEALRARERLWAHCVGTLEERGEPDPQRLWWRAGVLRLADGTRVEVPAIPVEGSPSVTVGDLVTVLGRVSAPEAEGDPWALPGQVRLCAGRVERCQVDDAWQRER